MASFQTHLSFGIALGVASVGLTIFFNLVPADWSFLALLALLAVVGAILPDMDSDSGVPFHVTFGSLAITAGGLGFWYALRHFPGDYRWIAGLPIGAMFFVWVVLGTIFKKLTHHRGIVHSIPAMLLAGMAIFSLAGVSGYDSWEAFLLGLAMALGFTLHLVLDEIFAAVNFHGIPFVPNKELGSALKLKSNSLGANAIVYIPLFFLLLRSGGTIAQLTGRLFGIVK
ncbi:MAG: metal-dependent hydrolase [Patescibacteria group bacterium]